QYLHTDANCGNWAPYMSPNVTLNIDNPAGIEFQSTYRTSAKLLFTHGNLGFPAYPGIAPPSGRFLLLDSTATITGASASSGWVTTQLFRRVTADGLVHFDVGDSVNYLPVDLNVHGVTQPGYLDAGTYGADLQTIAGAQLDLAHLAHRSW